MMEEMKMAKDKKLVESITSMDEDFAQVQGNLIRSVMSAVA